MMWQHQEKQKMTLPSLDFFFRARVPPNFPRKDSSFLIFAGWVVADVVPDIVEYVWCVRYCQFIILLLPVVHSGTGVYFNHSGGEKKKKKKEPDTWVRQQHKRTERGPGINIQTEWLTCESRPHPTAPPNGMMRNGFSKVREMMLLIYF